MFLIIVPRLSTVDEPFTFKSLITVTLIKDLKLKGSSTVLKRGTVIKNIHLTDNEDEIEGRTDKVKGLVLRVEFLKKA